jgi:hypothetical protein
MLGESSCKHLFSHNLHWSSFIDYSDKENNLESTSFVFQFENHRCNTAYWYFRPLVLCFRRKHITRTPARSSITIIQVFYTTKWKRDYVRTSQEARNVTTTKWKLDSVRTSQEARNVTTTKWKRDLVCTSQEARNVSTTKWKRDSVRTSQESHNVTTTKWKRKSWH